MIGIEGVIGSAHDDILEISSSGSVGKLIFNGLGGTDTLRFSGTGMSLDLGDNTITNIEVIDLTGTGANNLDLRAADVRQASASREEGKPVLRIDGDNDDTVNFLEDGWTRLDTTRTIGGKEYVVFDHAEARVLVVLDIAGTEGGAGKPSTYITGTARADNLVGTGLDDTIYGLAGNDVLEGKAGADVIDGGTGVDTASYKTSDSGVTVNLVIGAGFGGHAQGDTLSKIENLDGSGHADRLTGDGGANTLRGLGGDDTIEGKGGADTIEGGAGKDTASYKGSNSGVNVNLLAGTASGGHANGDTLSGIENLIGSDHADILMGDNDANVLVGGDHHDTLEARGGNDRVEGGKGNDRVAGWSGDDVLLGGEGNDLILGGSGADVIDGGRGVDTASYSYSSEGVEINLVTGRGSGGQAEGDQLTSIERILGSNHDDVLIIGNANFGHFNGLNGTDTIRISGSGVSLDLGGNSVRGIEIVDLTGTGANSLDLRAVDVLNGSGTRESGKAILRIDGNDDDQVNFLDDGWTRQEATRTIDGTEYAVFNYFYARVFVALEIVDGAAETPAIEIVGTSGADTLIGNELDNTISGLGGHDTIEGLAGADAIDGGTGTGHRHVQDVRQRRHGRSFGRNRVRRARRGRHAERDRESGRFRPRRPAYRRWRREHPSWTGWSRHNRRIGRSRHD